MPIIQGPNLWNNRQLNKKTEVGEREREGKNERKGKQFIALSAGTWSDQFWQDCGKAEAEGEEGSLLNDQTSKDQVSMNTRSRHIL